jgi:hypothetical protein
MFSKASAAIVDMHGQIEIRNPHLHSYRRGLVSHSAAACGDPFAWSGP